MTKQNCNSISPKSKSKRTPLSKYTTSYFIERAVSKHGDRFDYSKTVYVRDRQKVVIICSVHGEFEQTPSGHLKGRGCLKCSPNKQVGTDSFIKRSILKHGKKYSYHLSVYVKNTTKLKIQCLTCDAIFMQTPSDHLSGCGCPTCAGNTKLTTKDFIERSRSVHGDFYSYKKSVYTGSAYKLTITCPEHGDFKQKAQYHMNGMQCLKCSQSLSIWSRSDYIEMCEKKCGTSELYIVRMKSKSEVFYKIGITSQGISTRLNRGAQMPYDWDVVRALSGDAGFIWDLERKLHSINRANKYKPDLDFAGSTECFTEIPKGIYELIDRLSDTAQLPLIA